MRGRVASGRKMEMHGITVIFQIDIDTGSEVLLSEVTYHTTH